MKVPVNAFRDENMRLHGKTSVFLIVGLLFTAVACGGIYLYLNALEADLAEARAEIERLSEVEVVSVPVLARDLARGEEIGPDALRLSLVSASRLPEDVLRGLEDIRAGSDGKLLAARGLRAGNFLLRSNIAQPQVLGSANVMVPADAAAIMLQPANAGNIVDMLSPGDPVAVFWRDVGPDGVKTRLVASGLEVARPYAGGEDRADPESRASGAGENGADGKGLVVVGPTEEVAHLVQVTGRGEHFVLPATEVHLTENGELLISDSDLLGLPAFASSEGVGEVTQAGAAQDGVPAWYGLGAASRGRAERCQLNIVRSGARSTVEVPC